MPSDDGHLHVVLLEDSAPVRRRLKSLMLEQAKGCVVAEAPSVQDALRQLDGDDVDVVIVDIDLPDGTGMDVLRHLRRHQLRAVPIVLTNYDTPEFRLCCQALGAKHFLVKSEEFDQVPQLLLQIHAQMP